MADREFTFDVLLFATMRVKAVTEDEAREKLIEGVDIAHKHLVRALTGGRTS